jgi:hypothetical protein
METKAVRVFYRKANNQIVWYHELRGPGIFPTSVEEDLAEIPDKVTSVDLDAGGNVKTEYKLGGIPEDYGCIEEQDAQKAKSYFESDENAIVNGELVIGPPRKVE